MRLKGRWGLLLWLLLAVCLLVLATAVQKYQAFVERPIAITAPVIYHLEPGSGLRQVARQLAELDIVPNQLLFRSMVRLQRADRQLKSGEYLISPGMTPKTILQQLISGQVIQYSLTLPEGWSFRQLREKLTQIQAIKPLISEMSEQQIIAELGLSSERLEGLLLPETYFFSRGASDLQLLKRMAADMDHYLQKEWSNRDPAVPLNSAYEALILASIIERETARGGERGEIAGVFSRRLKLGMRLQTDPTVIYGLGDAFDGNLTRKHLRQPTPYNTYTIKGLPPTPIAMPGKAAIHAALNPEPGKSLYFVARGDGSHQFSDSLKQHQRAVRKFQIKH